MLRFLVLCSLLTTLWCGESLLDPVEARWSAAVAKAAQAWTAAIDKADAQVLREAERAAVSATRRNDAAAAAAAWTEVLRVDRNHEKARAALTTLSQLEATLTALDGEAGDDLLGNGAARSEDAEVRRAVDRRTKVVAEETAARDAIYRKVDAAAVADFERLALRAVGRGDLPGAHDAWYAVLRLDREHVKAREFFTGTGDQATVLAQLEAAGDPHRSALSVRGAAAVYILNQRTVTGRAGQWTAEDAAGGKPMTIAGMTALPAQPWLTFDGRTIGGIPDPTLVRTPPFSVACWLRPQGRQLDNTGVVADYVSGSWNGFLMQFEHGEITAWFLRDTANRVSVSRELGGLPGVPAPAGNWTHVVVTIDDKELVLYGNGKPVGRSPWLGKAGATSSPAPLTVGRYGRNYQGDLASILCWRRALSAGEVAGLAADTAPPTR